MSRNDKTRRQRAKSMARRAYIELNSGSAYSAKGLLIHALVELAGEYKPIDCYGGFPTTFAKSHSDRKEWITHQRHCIRQWFLRGSWMKFRYYHTDTEIKSTIKWEGASHDSAQ